MKRFGQESVSDEKRGSNCKRKKNTTRGRVQTVHRLTKIRPPCPVNLKLQDCWTPVDGSHHSAVVVIYSGSCLYFRTCSCPVFLHSVFRSQKRGSLASQLFYCGMQHQPQHVNLFHTLYSLRQKKVTSALFVSFFKLLQI